MSHVKSGLCSSTCLYTVTAKSKCPIVLLNLHNRLSAQRVNAERTYGDMKDLLSVYKGCLSWTIWLSMKSHRLRYVPQTLWFNAPLGSSCQCIRACKLKQTSGVWLSSPCFKCIKSETCLSIRQSISGTTLTSCFPVWTAFQAHETSTL